MNLVTAAMSWAAAHPAPAAIIAGTALVLAAATAWGTVRAVRWAVHTVAGWTLPPPYVLFAGLAAALCTAYSADTSWRFAEHRLGMDDPVERAAMFAAAEVALLACTVMARANVKAGTTTDRLGTPGLPGTLVWVITGVQIVPCYAESGVIGGTVRAVIGPVLAGLMWHQVMGLEVKIARPRALSSGLLHQIGRELRERTLAHLGLAQRGRDAVQISRDLATARAVRLASRSRLGPWGRSRLAAAVARAAVGVDADQRHQLLLLLAARRGAVALRTIDVPSPWELPTPDTAPALETGQDTETGQQQDTRDTGQDTETPGRDTPVLPAQPPVPPRPAPADPVIIPFQPAALSGAGQQVAGRGTAVLPTTAGQDTGKPDVPPAVPSRRPSRPGGPSVRDTILEALRAGVDEDDRDTLRARAEAVHGEVKDGTFRKSRLRAIEAFHEGEGFYP
ncbi:MAG TPA: hypothetical protein VFY14_03955 [Streptomyces sp.]|nr:hypothetical protein [Streptomyces sp.]